MTITANNAFPETYQLAALAPQNIQVLMRGLDFLFLRYVQDQWWNHQLIAGLITKQWGFASFLKKVYGDIYDWDSTELFNAETLRKFLEKISEIGWFWYERDLSYEEKISFDFSEWEMPIWFLGKKFFENKNIQANDIDFVESFLRYHLIQRLIEETEYYKNQQKNIMSRLNFSIDMQRICEYILVTGIALFDIPESTILLQRALFIISKSGELPIAVIEECNQKLEIILNWDNEDNLSMRDRFVSLNAKIQDILIETCGSYGTMEFTRFQVQTVLIWENNIDDLSKCLVKLLPIENFYFRKNEEIVSEAPELFPIQGNLIRNNNLIIGPRNCNIFDPSGNKIFWWDISQSDIEKIKWTYYTLTQSEWWSHVPDFLKGNIRSIAPTIDIFSPGYMKDPFTWSELAIPSDVQWVEPEYVRMMAYAKIENGKYIKNKRTIELL